MTEYVIKHSGTGEGASEMERRRETEWEGGGWGERVMDEMQHLLREDKLGMTEHGVSDIENRGDCQVVVEKSRVIV